MRSSSRRLRSENFIAFGRYGYFSTLDPLYMENTGTRRLPLSPTAPTELDGLGRRLHDRAVADGQLDVAAKITFVFGNVTCADCGTRFRVDEAVVYRWEATAPGDLDVATHGRSQ